MNDREKCSVCGSDDWDTRGFMRMMIVSDGKRFCPKCREEEERKSSKDRKETV